VKQDRYLAIIRRALAQTADRPYTFWDLLRAYDVMTDEFCHSIDPWCSRTELLDWLLGIGPQGQDALLNRINGEYPGWPAEDRPRRERTVDVVN
jgi:hypothetical protein